jgi:hypothetical protein
MWRLIRLVRSALTGQQYPIGGSMPAGPYEGQVPVREYENDRAREGRMQLIEISVAGHQQAYGLELSHKPHR